MLTCARCGSAVFSGASDCAKCGHLVATPRPAGGSAHVSDGTSSTERASQAGFDPSLGPLGNLWQGNYNLPKTFWGFGVAGTFGLAVLYFGLMIITRPSRTLQDNIVHYGWLVLLAWNLFVTLAVWKSGAKYAKAGGNGIWVFLSRASAIVGLAQMAYIAVRLFRE
jgi:hypothetical protein